MLQIFLIAVSLAMDAFAVAVSTGISVPGFGGREAARIGLWCGAFQFLMPLAGWVLGSSVRSYIVFIDHWIAFGLLALIGGNMIREGLSGQGEEGMADLSVRRLFLLALATSIDALAVGVSLAALEAPILFAAGFIAAVTFCCTLLGLWLGRACGPSLGSRAQILGGGILVAIGVKIFLEHTFL